MVVQRPFAPDAGFIGEVPTGRYPAFPATPLKRLRWAMEAPIKSPAGKVVLIVLTFHANEKGKAWPSVKTIAGEASLSRRAAVDAIRRLERASWLTVLQRARLTSVYRPRAPTDQHCRHCWSVLPGETDLCPVCGWELGVQELHVGVQQLHPIF